MSADAVGGVWTYALDLCAALAPFDIDVVLATMGPQPNAAQREQVRQLANIRLITSNHRLEWMAEPWSDLERAGEWLLELTARHDVQLVHLNGYVHAALPFRKPCVVAAHSCVYSWWQDVHRSNPPATWERYHRMVRTGLNHATTIVAPTRAFLERLRSNYEPVVSSSVIHNARSPAPFRRAAEDEPRRACILACGRLWDEAKNMRALDEAACGLPWPVYVAGDCVAPDGKQFAADSLRCLGRLEVPQLAQWLRRSTMFVHPARYEPFGLSILEAAHAGCALVLADIPTLRELWDDAAAFVEADDAAGMHRTLRALIDDPERRKHLARSALQRAQEFSLEYMGRCYASLYRELLNSYSPRECAVA